MHYLILATSDGGMIGRALRWFVQWLISVNETRFSALGDAIWERVLAFPNIPGDAMDILEAVNSWVAISEGTGAFVNFLGIYCSVWLIKRVLGLVPTITYG